MAQALVDGNKDVMKATKPPDIGNATGSLEKTNVNVGNIFCFKIKNWKELTLTKTFKN